MSMNVKTKTTIDGYEVEIILKNVVLTDQPDLEKPDHTIADVDYEFSVLYDFQDQESYESVHKQVENRIPDFLEQLIHDAIVATINDLDETKEIEV